MVADIQAMSVAVASASVVAGVVYYAFQVRHQNKMRRLDLFMRLYSIWGTKDMLNAHRRFMTIKVEGYESFVNKHGPVTEPSQIYTDIDQIGWFFNLMGFMVKEKIIHMKLIDELLGYWVTKNWETIKSLVYG